MNHLAIVETILRSRAEFFNEIRDSICLRQKILAMMLSSFIFLAIYGGVMGASNSLPQVFSSALKLPVLFLITLVICTPSLYFFNLLFGSKQTILQNVALILTAVTTTSVLLLSFAPITLFFLTTTSEYQFFKLLNVAIFAISGAMGVVFLRQGYRASVDADNPEGTSARRTLFILWIVLYGFVGSQMAWTLRPFMGAPSEPFQIVRQTGGNFYTNVIQSVNDLLGPEK
ncbi:MAG: actin-binding WH2 domain-containing protein [Chloroflexi bacterium]|nr:actin-binding WH2 domain-containing protein [Chloroflexota bacterium]